MEQVYVYLSYEKDPNKEYGIGFFVKFDLVEHFKKIAKENKLYMLVELEFDFLDEELNNGA